MHNLIMGDGDIGATKRFTAWVDADAKIDSSAPPSERVCASCLVSMSSGLHWRQLIFCFPERTLYYFEGFGGEPNGVDAANLMRAFKSILKPRGWRIESVRLELQTDGVNCGVWVIVCRDCFLVYAASDVFGTGQFASYMAQWLVEKGVCDIKPLSGIARRRARQANDSYIVKQRAEVLTRPPVPPPTHLRPPALTPTYLPTSIPTSIPTRHTPPARLHNLLINTTHCPITYRFAL